LDARAVSTTTPQPRVGTRYGGERRDVRPLSREPHDWGLFNSAFHNIHWKRKADAWSQFAGSMVLGGTLSIFCGER